MRDEISSQIIGRAHVSTCRLHVLVALCVIHALWTTTRAELIGLRQSVGINFGNPCGCAPHLKRIEHLTLEDLFPSFLELLVEHHREDVIAEIAIGERPTCRCGGVKLQGIEKLCVRKFACECCSNLDWPAPNPVRVREEIA